MRILLKIEGVIRTAASVYGVSLEKKKLFSSW